MAVKLELVEPPIFYWVTFHLEFGKTVKGILARDFAPLDGFYNDADSEITGVMLKGIFRDDGLTVFRFKKESIRFLDLVPIQSKIETEEVSKTYAYHLGEAHEAIRHG